MYVFLPILFPTSQPSFSVCSENEMTLYVFNAFESDFSDTDHMNFYNAIFAIQTLFE